MSSVRSCQLQHDTVHRGWFASIPLCVLLLSPALAEPARPIETTAGVATAATTDPVSPDVIKQREQELEQARAAQKSAAEAQAKLKADMAALGQDSSKLSQQLIEAAKTKFAADVVEPRAITLSQIAFRPLLQSANRDHNDAHG